MSAVAVSSAAAGGAAGAPPPARVAVKICGVGDRESAALAARLGADFIGLNFWPGSPRYLDARRAREVADAARAAAPGIAVVGVFVNPTAAEVAAAESAAGLDLLQFSGDEAAAALARWAARAIKALRLDPAAGGAAGAAPDAAAAAAVDYAACWGLLFDSPGGAGAAAYGGSGLAWEYARLARLPAALARRRVFLAGGLGPDNVRGVVAAIRPFAVDVCSRVESAPGRKDPQRLELLFEEIRHGQAASAT